jgi:hypothetical protein
MSDFRELADSLGVQRPEFTDEMRLGQMVAARLDHIEDVVAAAISDLRHVLIGP